MKEDTNASDPSLWSAVQHFLAGAPCQPRRNGLPALTCPVVGSGRAGGEGGGGEFRNPAAT